MLVITVAQLIEMILSFLVSFLVSVFIVLHCNQFLKEKINLQPPATSRTRKDNIIVHLPGTKGAAKNVKSIYICCILCFFHDFVFQLLVENTNIYVYVYTVKGTT